MLSAGRGPAEPLVKVIGARSHSTDGVRGKRTSPRYGGEEDTDGPLIRAPPLTRLRGVISAPSRSNLGRISRLSISDLGAALALAVPRSDQSIVHVTEAEVGGVLDERALTGSLETIACARIAGVPTRYHTHAR